jgi:outer membrane immunogenic protein
MNTRNVLCSAAAAIAGTVAVPAFAAGPVAVVEEPMIMPPVTVMPSADWTGPYVGAQLGWGWASGDTNVDLSEFDLDDADADLDGSGWVGGFNAGYRHDFGQWVVGGEVQYDWAGVEFDELDIDSDDVDIDIDLDDDEGSLDSIWRAKALVGYDLGRTLVYGSGGYAHAAGEFGGDDIDGDGWVIGAGADYSLTESLSVGGEVMYHQFSDFGGEGSDMNFTTLQAKMTYRF